MKQETQPKQEEMLLIGLCRMSFTPEQIQNIRLIAHSISDWEYFAKLANDHGISALVYNNLEKHSLINLLPGKSLSFLKNAFLLSMTRNAALMNMLGNVVKNINVRTILLKGAALELMVYGNRGLRQMSDVDILLTREDCFTSYRYMTERLGFKPFRLKSIIHKSIIGYYGKHLPSLLKNGYSIELHHDLFDEENRRLTGIFYESATEKDLGMAKVLLPEPCIFFLYLVKHLYSHELGNDSQLRLHADLVIMLENYYDSIISPQLLKYSASGGLDVILATKLSILEEFWHFEFPGYIREFIITNKDDDTIKRFVFFLGSPKNNPPGEKRSSYKKTIKNIPGWHRKILYVLGDLFPTVSFMKERYNCNSAWRVFFYYPHRWGKVIWLLGRDKER